jgi:hypothetical protein
MRHRYLVIARAGDLFRRDGLLQPLALIAVQVQIERFLRLIHLLDCARSKAESLLFFRAEATDTQPCASS